jgi:putative membrane protein
MLLLHPITEVGRALPALVLLVFAGSGSGHGSYWGLIGTAVVIVLAITRWFTTRYRITADQVQLRHGLLRRKTVAAPLDRVRTVDVTAHALHRVLGLARVVIGTGTSDRNGHRGLTLDGLDAPAAARLRAELLHRAVPPTTRPVAEPGGDVSVAEVELARLDRRWIRFAPFTLSGALTAAVIGGFLWRLQNETQGDLTRSGPFHALLAHLRSITIARAAAEVGGTVVLFIAAASTLGYVLAFWNFRLSRHPGGTLHVSRGLLTTRATSIEERRLRGVELSEPLLLRLVGGARVLAIATGLRVGRGAERGGTILLPPAPRARAVEIATRVIDDGAPLTAAVTPHGPAAARRRYARALAGGALLVLAIETTWYLVGASDWVRFATLVALPLSVPLAADRARNLGHALVPGYLVTRRGSLVRRRCAVETDAIIGWTFRSSFVQRRAGLVTLTATTAAGRQSYRVQDIDADKAVPFAAAATPGLLDEFAP